MALFSHSLLPVLNSSQYSSDTLSKALLLNSTSTTSQFPLKPSTYDTKHHLSNAPVSVSEKWRAKVSFFPVFLKKGKDDKPLKEELLEAIAPLDRGAEATPEDQQRVDQIIRKVEAVNPTKEPLKSELLNGKWELLYTTSQSILQT